MSNVIRSFRQGFQATNDVFDRANDIEDRKDAIERRNTLRDRQDTAWEQGQQDRETQLERNNTSWEQGQEDRKRNIKRQETADKQNAESHSLSMKTGKAQLENFNFNNKIKQRRLDGQTLQDQLIRSQSTNDLSWFDSPEAQELYKRNPALDPRWITDNETYNAAGRLTNVLNGVANGQLPQWNDQDLIDDLNQLFPEITNSSDLPQMTKDGKKIIGRKIVGVVPLEGGKVAVQLAITDEDGKTYNAPMTESRSSNGDDNVMQIGLDQLSNRINLVHQGQQEQIFKSTADYMHRLSGKTSSGSDKTANEMRKELFKAENDIRTNFEKQRDDARKDINLSNDPEALKARLNEIDESERQQLAQVRLSLGNIYGGNFDPNLEGTQRNKQINATLTQYKDANPSVQWTPELTAAVRESIEAGDDNDFVQELISRNSQNQKPSPTDNQSEVASLFDRFTGGSKQGPETSENQGGQSPAGESTAQQQEIDAVTEQISQEGLTAGQIEQILNESNLPSDIKRQLYDKAVYGTDLSYNDDNVITQRAKESSAAQQAEPKPIGLAQRMALAQRG